MDCINSQGPVFSAKCLWNRDCDIQLCPRPTLASKPAQSSLCAFFLHDITLSNLPMPDRPVRDTP